MLIYYFVYVPGRVEDVAKSLTDSPLELTAWAKLAYEGAEELRTKVGVGPWVPAKEVELVVYKPVARQGGIQIPIFWKATGPDALFPTLEADLVLEPVGDSMTQLTLRGSYRPPMGWLGELLDRAVLHRLAEACVKNFLDRIAAAFQSVDAAADTPS